MECCNNQGECIEFIPENLSLDGLNFLASRLAEMEDWQRTAFKGLVQMEKEPPTMRTLINITYNMEDVQCIPVKNDAELREFYLDNGFVDAVNEIPDEYREEILEFINPEKVGHIQREAESGVYVDGHYVVKDFEGLKLDWIYAQLVGFLGEFFAMMGNMGAELFEMSWVQAIVLFFSCLAWALYGTGLVVSVFQYGIEYQSGRGSIKDTALNAIKGFMAVNLFNIVPVELYKLAVTLQGNFTSGITGMIGTNGGISTMSAAALTNLGGLGLNPIMGIFIVILMGYAIIKVFLQI